MQEAKDDKKVPLITKTTNVSKFEEIFTSEISKGRAETLFKEHFTNSETLLKMLKTSRENGLNPQDEADIKERIKEYGDNKIEEDEDFGFFHFVWETLHDPTLQILLVASAVSLVIGILQEGLATGWIEGVAIFFAVFLVVSISSFMNYNQQKQFTILNHETKMKKVTVIRNSASKLIEVEDLLVGDILCLKIGDIINVDGYLVSDSVSMNESSVTGESNLVKKVPEFRGKLEEEKPRTTNLMVSTSAEKTGEGEDEEGEEEEASEDSKYLTPFLLSGTEVQDGQGKMVVCAVGRNSFSGRNKELLKVQGEGEEDKTPLGKQLDDLADAIGDAGYIMAILIGCLMILKEIIIRIATGEPIFNASILDVIVNAFIICVTVIVVAIPEGLPMAVTISLAYSVEKMKDEHNLVKHLDKSEAMGNVNNVCTDKTGTLTTGVMQINNVFIWGKDYKVSESASIDKSARSVIQNVIYNNITAYEVEIDGKKTISGDMTECALLKFLISEGFQTGEHLQPVYVLPFKSQYKYMVMIYKQSNGYKLYIKGAPERVVPFCTGGYDMGAKIPKPMDDDTRGMLEKQQHIYAMKMLRTLFFASKDLTKQEVDAAVAKFPKLSLKFFQRLARGSVLNLMVGIGDPSRVEVPESIKKCKEAGIIVRMVTGDNIYTAVAISKDVGIITDTENNEVLSLLESKKDAGASNMPGYLQAMMKAEKDQKLKSPIALDGKQFREMSGGLSKTVNSDDPRAKPEYKLNDPEKFRDTVKNLKVIARASPEDKFLLVFGLKKQNNIVAVTGDGTNDAPALKQSHVGFAMGIRGTDIAKEAADIILLDDSFSSIVTACKYGRNVYDCIRKFIQFQLTTNVVAVFMTLMGGIILKDSPLNAIEMLWVNLIMDSFASLALATESPTDELLKRKPYRRDAGLLTPMMKINIISQAIFQVIVLTIILFYGDVLFGVPSDRGLEHFQWNDINGYHFTIFFNIFVFLQVFNSINARKLNKGDFNVFSGIGGNMYYIVVQGLIVFGQIILVSVGGRAVRTHPLTIGQHFACMCIASLTLGVGLLVKFIPFDISEGEAEEKKKGPSFGYKSRGGAIRLKMNTSPK